MARQDFQGAGSLRQPFNKDQLDTSGGGTPLTSSPNYNGLETNGTNSTTSFAPAKASVLKFPTNRQDAYPASMIFEPYKVDAYKIDGDAAANIFDVPLLERFFGKKVSPSTTFADIEDDEAEAAAEATAAAEAAATAATQQKVNDAQAIMGNKLTDLRAYRDDKASAIALFLPASLVYNDNVAYSDVNLGSKGLTAIGGMNAGKSITGSLAKGVAEGVENIFNLLSGQLSGQAAQLAAARAAQFIPGEGLKGAASIGLQTGLNPGTRILFEKPNIRQFTFQFKLIPTSEQEANTIQQIIKEFRYQMYPREIDIKNIPIGYEFPNTYRISFKFAGGTLKIPKIQFCYLRDVQVTYNGGTGGVFFYDGQPTEVDLTLIFSEYRPLSKRDIEAGF